MSVAHQKTSAGPAISVPFERRRWRSSRSSRNHAGPQRLPRPRVPRRVSRGATVQRPNPEALVRALRRDRAAAGGRVGRRPASVRRADRHGRLLIARTGSELVIPALRPTLESIGRRLKRTSRGSRRPSVSIACQRGAATPPPRLSVNRSFTSATPASPRRCWARIPASTRVHRQPTVRALSARTGTLRVAPAELDRGRVDLHRCRLARLARLNGSARMPRRRSALAPVGPSTERAGRPAHDAWLPPRDC